jgi:hypothetical protein
MAMEAKRRLQDRMISAVLQWAPSLLAIQNSYRQKKSSLVGTADVGRWSIPSHAPSQTMLT